jgi:hypothetical protein
VGRGWEFCSHACISRWALAMQSAHERQRSKPEPVKAAPKPAALTPLERALAVPS